jgi:transglutaminase-like putative cysteine protease
VMDVSQEIDTSMLTVRVGCDLIFNCAESAAMVLVVKPQRDPERPIVSEELRFDPEVEVEEFTDRFGNQLHRARFGSGVHRVRHDAIARVPSLTDKDHPIGAPERPEEIPAAILRYVLPSRYCDSDKLADFAWRNFGTIPHGGERVQAMCDWLHENIEYRYGSGRPDISAHEIIERGYGVCRDFAHCLVALCRTFNLPARYVTGHLPDIGYVDPGTPMDFHAYAEVYIGGMWHTFDARYNVPRIGRLKIAHGLDAVDCAFATGFGHAKLESIEVWAYQVDPGDLAIGTPIDLSKRLDGTETILFSADQRFVTR